jgi:N-acetylmuramoyl-L-alanine amidase
MRDIDKIILHCSATPEGRNVSVETIREWHKARGWSDIGYHYVVMLDGTIEEGRPLERQGAHVRGHNKGSIGICYIGGLDSDMKAKDTRTDAQIASLSAFLEFLMVEYPKATLHGHNEFSAKACPSFIVKDEYKYLIDCYER